MPDKRLSPVYYNKMKFAEDHIHGSKKLLDVGCGEGGYFFLYKEMGISYDGIEPDESIIKPGEPVKVAVAEKIPFPQASFDTIICMDVMEHVNDPKKAMEEIRRVMKPHGKLVISVPSARYPFTYDPINALLRLFGRHINGFGMWGWGHRRLYKREDIIRLLESCGFRIKHTEEITHGFVAFFLSYVPWFSVHVLAPLVMRLGIKKTKINVTGKPIQGGIFFKLISVINLMDQKYFSKTHGITICVIASKN